VAVERDRAAWCFQSRSHTGDFPAADEQISVLHSALRASCPDRRTLNQQCGGLGRFRPATEDARGIDDGIRKENP